MPQLTVVQLHTKYQKVQLLKKLVNSQLLPLRVENLRLRSHCLEREF